MLYISTFNAVSLTVWSLPLAAVPRGYMVAVCRAANSANTLSMELKSVF